MVAANWVRVVSFGSWLFVVHNTLAFHQMEFEADLYSIYSHDSTLPEGDCRFVERAEDMADALLRLAAISPNLYERGRTCIRVFGSDWS